MSTAPATIRISGLKLRTIIGTNARERKKKQTVVAHIAFEYDAARAAAKDDLRHAVDYDQMAKAIIKEAQAARFFLLESLADSILKTVLGFSGVQRAIVRLEKPQALCRAGSVSAEISRARANGKAKR